MAKREGRRRHITTKPGLPLLIGSLKRTARKAGAHVGCCYGTHLGDGSLLPKMAALLLLGRPAEIHVSGAPSFLSLVPLSRSDSSVYVIELTEPFKNTHRARCRLRSAALL